MIWMRFSKKGCAKLYVRCVNNIVIFEFGFDRVFYFIILVIIFYMFLLLIGVICSVC